MNRRAIEHTSAEVDHRTDILTHTNDHTDGRIQSAHNLDTTAVDPYYTRLVILHIFDMFSSIKVLYTPVYLTCIDAYS